MTNFTANSSTRCCDANKAWAWCEIVAEMALAGDTDAVRLLPQAIGHYLVVTR